jgi:hypothetical protein
MTRCAYSHGHQLDAKWLDIAKAPLALVQFEHKMVR